MEQEATLGGGCFWCLEAVYQEVKGVISIVSGYAGGTTENPTHEDTYYEDTGHAQVVQLSYDANVISYKELLEIFFYIHDPTTLNRQMYDQGSVYRSIILYHNDLQKKIAEEMVSEFAPTLWGDPIVTEIKPLDKFWPAEEYHQNFYRNNEQVGYCQVIINPKLAKFRQKFKSKLRGSF